ncbi:S-layer homology domain-containing protein [Paenibacillus solisilvae]|uniref:S-layer homology domain-containing protein n=1 Tax=Paenibacillus solisilvae TaxID=2486751 RepID=A0ABW0VW73_9BACL
MVSANGVPVSVSNDVYGPIDLNVGSNTISFEVKDENQTKTTYQVVVNRAAAVSDDASLKQLQIDHTSVNISADQTEYAVGVGNSVSSVTVTAAANDADAALEMNDEAENTKLINLSEGLNIVTVKVTAQDGATQKIYTLKITRALSQTATDTPVQVSTDPLSLIVPSGVTNASIQTLPDITGDTKQAILPLVEVKANTSLGDISLNIPSGTTISTSSAWDGRIKLPELLSNDSVVVINGTVSSVIEVGSPDVSLTFDKAVRLLIPNHAGKLAGFVRDGMLVPITKSISADTQEAANQEIPEGGEAAISIGGDLVIWTKHFTKFVSYSSVPVIGQPGNGGPTNAGVVINAAEGGTVTLNGAKIVIPAGASDSDISITVDKVINTDGLFTDAALKLVSNVYEIRKDKDGEFTEDVSITLPFNGAEVDETKSTVSIYWFNETEKKWIPLGNPQIDTGQSVVTGTVNHFTKFAVLTTDKLVKLSDIQGHWAENSIRELVGAGVINGYPDGTFAPDRSVSRAEFAVMVVKAFGLEDTSGETFADIAGHWARTSIETALAHEIITGYNVNTFGPDDLISREQMAAMIVRAAKLPEGTMPMMFTDSSMISEWAKSAVAAAVEHSLITGYKNIFRPKVSATRAEAVTVILKAIKE